MRRTGLLMVLAAAGCAAGSGSTAKGGGDSAELSARLAGATFGRVPGRVATCVGLVEIRGNRALGSELILFEGTGGRQWVNRPHACPALAYRRTLRLAQPSGRLCKGDSVQVVDPGTNGVLGTCTLGDFLSYVPRR